MAEDQGAKERGDHIGVYPAARAPRSARYPDDPPTVPLVYQLTLVRGKGSVVVALDDALAAPLRKVATTGSPAGDWHYVCVQEHDRPAPTVLGALMVSRARRMIFFPGTQLELGDDEGLGRFRGKALDHITLDPPANGRWTSHVTLRHGSTRKRHGLRNSAFERPGEMLPWLTLLTPTLAAFPSLPRRLSLPLDWPGGDVVRFTQSALGNSFHQTAVADGPPKSHGEHFWQIDFLVGSGPDWRSKRHAPVRYSGADHLISYDFAPNQPRVAGVVVSSLSDELGAMLMITRPSGVLRSQCFITPPPEWFPHEGERPAT